MGISVLNRPLSGVLRATAKALRANTTAVVLASIVLVQSPFVVLYFARQRGLELHSAPSRTHRRTASSREGVLPPVLPHRDDPFVLLPGMQAPADQTAQTPSGEEVSVMNAFRSLPPVPAETRESIGDKTPPPMEIKPMPLPDLGSSPGAAATNMTPASPTRAPAIRLTGIARYHGKGMAVFQLADKSTVQTMEGDHIAGTNYSVRSITPERVCIAKSTDDREPIALVLGEIPRP